MTSRLASGLALLLAACADGRDAAAQRADLPAVTLGWAVDTTRTPVREIVRTVLAYYRLPEPGRTQTPLWDAAEQAARPDPYDLAAAGGGYGSGFPATIMGVLPTAPDSALWEVRVLFAKADSGGGNVQPLALQRLYARRAAPGTPAPHGWQLSGALAELTRGWTVRRVGPLVYHHAPGYPFDSARAARAAQFVVEAASRVGVPTPERIDYYVTASWAASEQLRGLDWGLNAVAFAGRAVPSARLVFAGHPSFGEAFLHEIAHVVAGPLGPVERQHLAVTEGLATWLGGGNLGGVDRYYALLREYQRANPGVSLARLLDRPQLGAPVYATGAVVVDAVVRRGGRAALRRLIAAGPDTSQLLVALPPLLGVPEAGLEAWWRTETERLAGGTRPP